MNDQETSADKEAQEPWNQTWPSGSLELVTNCPVCGERKRRILYSHLVDNVFRVAPGKWTLWECANCNSAYLSPRPTHDTIEQAYKTYYTHTVAIKRDELSLLNRFRLFRRALANGYLNHQYGTYYLPASSFGPIFARIFPDQREILDIQFRWLPKPETGQRLLDVGCGNGGFLMKARDAGWKVVGVDPDVSAVEVAQGQGLDVRMGFVEMLNDEVEYFDVVTLSQVIEHVHEPRDLLAAVHGVLKPGGILYLDTPNIQSLGAKLFGANWRGIESPRHLVLFSVSGLQSILESCGFSDFEFRSRKYAMKGMFESSYRLEQGSTIVDDSIQKSLVRAASKMCIPFLPVSKLDFITLLARKK